jgi:drug/metabolite transporter (DMT)-like permease
MTSAAALSPRRALAAAAGWAALVTFETLAQVALKIAADRLGDGLAAGDWLAAAVVEPWVWVGALAYLGSFAAWMTILDRLPLSRGFPLTAVVYVAVAAASLIAFGETITPLRWCGIGLIVVGVVVIGGEDEP